MYGNFEYGVIPYGDTTSSVTIFLLSTDVDLIFKSDYRPLTFLSARQDDIFRIVESLEKTRARTISSRKLTMFISLNKKNIFRSE